MSSVSPLTAGVRRSLPPPCVSCVFWQHDRIATDERRKEAWADAFGRRHGAFGRVLHDAGGFQGMVQYGPSGAFPRALGLPAGPPGRDARPPAPGAGARLSAGGGLRGPVAVRVAVPPDRSRR